jgi:hypothetical protein
VHTFLDGHLKIEYDIDDYGNTIVVGAWLQGGELDITNDEVMHFIDVIHTSETVPYGGGQTWIRHK